MKRDNNQTTGQRGFFNLELLLVTGVIMLIVGLLVYVYTERPVSTPAQQIEQPTGTSTGTSTSPNGIPGGAKAGITAQPGSPTTNIKIIPAGLQISVPDSLKDLTYTIKPTADGKTDITFSTKTIAARMPSCASDQGSGAFQTITRGPGSYPGPANPSSGALLKQYSNYYFAYSLPTGPCAKGLSVDNQNLLNSLAQDFSGTLPSVTALL